LPRRKERGRGREREREKEREGDGKNRWIVCSYASLPATINSRKHDAPPPPPPPPLLASAVDSTAGLSVSVAR
jgi:hypothetical protein